VTTTAIQRTGSQALQRSARRRSSVRYELRPARPTQRIKQCCLDPFGVSIGASTLSEDILNWTVAENWRPTRPFGVVSGVDGENVAAR
jgi:hypothetical protein